MNSSEANRNRIFILLIHRGGRKKIPLGEGLRGDTHLEEQWNMLPYYKFQ